ncbi:murein biosynthesis integral membrane protein MurJ [Estrella lausannensis]|uniref:Lipid II flippase n=1 Tax=Estrella lausannensis TaxID=483423 RepID=A0A0H5DNI8_9BACT|nr:murein biosynthesis integral membrane protein MurJ [Estrella lausannensis]CRX37787.1 Virulence factor mviN homolog [Estrella lausannensis]
MDQVNQASLSKESSRSILRSMSRFLSGTMLSRISGLGRDIAMAYAFGTEASAAAFLVSFRLAHLLRRILGEGCLQTAFIPLFEELRRESVQKAHAFYIHLQSTLFWILLLVSTAAMGALGLPLSSLDLSPGNREILSYTLFMMPSLVFICLYGLSASLLQCEGSYFLAGASPVAFNLAWIAGAILLRGFDVEQAMPYLCLFIILGCFLQWAVCYPKTKKLIPHSPLTLFSFRGIQPDVMRIVKPMTLGMIGIAATQINTALDAVFARFASLEGPAYLWYAIRIEQLPLALFGIALSGALLPPLSRAMKNGDLKKAAALYSSSIGTCIAVIVPMTFALVFSGRATVSLLYERGDFSAVSAGETALCLYGYALGLLPSVTVLLTAPVYYALSDYKTPALASGYSVVINSILSAAGVLAFGFGAFWIAVATSLSAIANALILSCSLPKEISFPWHAYSAKFFRALAHSLLYAVGVYFLLPDPTGSLTAGTAPSFTGSLYLFSLHLTIFALCIAPLWYRELKDLKR